MQFHHNVMGLVRDHMGPISDSQDIFSSQLLTLASRFCTWRASRRKQSSESNPHDHVADVSDDNYTKRKDPGHLERALLRNLDVRYMKNIREKIKSPYSCNQRLCPKIKERYDQHREKHHCSSLKTLDTSNDQSKSCRWQDVALSPVMSTGLILNQHSTDTHSVQANLSSANADKYATNSVESKDREQTQVTESSKEANEVALRKTETKSVITPKRYFYAEHLEYEILKWMTSVPIYPYLNESSTILRKKVVNDLINKINELSSQFNNQPDYQEKVKREINVCLNTLPIWYPGARRNQVQFKNNLCDNLLRKINNLNITYFGNIDNTSFQDIGNISKCHMDDHTLLDEVEDEIFEWLTPILIKTENVGKDINKVDVKQIFLNRLRSMLNKPMTTKNYKLILKGKIVDIFNDLPLMISSRNKRLYHNRLAEELANRILSIKARREWSGKSISHNNKCYPKIHSALFHRCANEVIGLNLVPKTNLKLALIEEVTDCLHKSKINVIGDISEDITNILIDNIEAVCSGEDKIVKNEIQKYLYQICNVSESQAVCEATAIVKRVRNVMTRDLLYKKQSTEGINLEEFDLPSTVFISQSKSNRSSPLIYPVTSTPKRRELPTPKKDIAKLNAGEKSYLDKLGTIIRNWLNKLPSNYNVSRDKQYKEMVIMDLAGDIMDAVKLSQMVPDEMSDKRENFTYIIRRWLLRFEMIDNLNEANKYVYDLLKDIMNEPEPKMTRPQHGSRQAMANVKHVFDKDADQGFVPQARDVLEDEISIWVNEQSTDIYLEPDKSFLNKMVQELADKVQQKLVDKKPSKEIADDVIQWLDKIVKPEVKINVNKMSEKLKQRILKLPQDKTLAENYIKRLKGRIPMTTVTNEPIFPCCNKCTTETDPGKENVKETDKTLKEVIAKFIEHNYNVDDPTARGAFNQLLIAEMRKLTPPTEKEIYENFQTHEVFSPEKLTKELQILKDVSDWLKNVPMDGPFNLPGNENRVDFVNGLAKEICEIEENRIKLPGQMDYDVYLVSIILEHMRQLPISKNHSQNIGFMIKQLENKIVANRPPISCCQNSPERTISSIHSSGIHAENLADFIEEFICMNGSDIGDDELKLEAWATRLLKELKIMIHNNPDANYLSKAEVYNKLINVPIPGGEYVRCFNLKLDYAKEICDWLNNLPLSPISSQQNNDILSTMVSNLAERMCEREKTKKENPNDSLADEQLVHYIAVWISELPLDPQHEIALPVVIHQLMNRMERVDRENLIKESGLRSTDNQMNKSAKSSPKPQKKASTFKSSKTKRGKNQSDNPEDLIANAIQNWCNNLQVQGETEDATKIIKNDLATKIFRKIGELNADPEIFNNDYLYEDMLTDAIDVILENVPKSLNFKNNTQDIIKTLTEQIIEGKKYIKQLIAGENYKKQLENTINESISNAFPWVKIYDPGFQMYKNRIATMFLLENFDHSNEAVKLNYEKKINEEINKYFQSVLNRNPLPLTQDQLRNELYSNLFQIPIPNETSVLDEVEEVKTRCEVDAWYEELPLQEPSGLGELLERDNVLTMLSKRIHEIERKEARPDEKLRSEIKKWLSKLPLLPEHRDNVDQLVKDLEKRLKSTEKARKCKPADKNISRKSTDTKSTKKVSRSDKSLKESVQTPGSSNARPNGPCCKTTTVPQQKAADIIIEIVEFWCSQLPLNANTPQEVESVKALKQNLITKIIIKISELNDNSETFNNDLVYDNLLNEELEKLLATLPVCCDFQQSKNARKFQLIEAIKSIKPLIKQDKSRQIYKQQLYETANSILEAPQDTTAEKLAMFHNIMEEIINDFAEYYYNKDDDDIKQLYKLKLHEAMMKYFSNVSNKDEPVDILILRNKLICELAKVPVPSEDVLREEIQEIRMKNEVSIFFNNLSFKEPDNDSTIRNHIKTVLAKILNEIEKTGHNCTNHKLMKDEIIKCLHKLGAEINSQKIDAFIEKLKENEMTRKAPPPTKPGSCCLNKPTARAPINGSSANRSRMSLLTSNNLQRNESSGPPVMGYNQQPIQGVNPCCATGSNQSTSSPIGSGGPVPIAAAGPYTAGLAATHNLSNNETEWLSLKSGHLTIDDEMLQELEHQIINDQQACALRNNRQKVPYDIQESMEHSLIIQGGVLINPLSGIYPDSFVSQPSQWQVPNQSTNIPPIPAAPITALSKKGEPTHQSICSNINVDKACIQSETNNQNQLISSQIQYDQLVQRSLGSQLPSQSPGRAPFVPREQNETPVGPNPPCCQHATSVGPAPLHSQPAVPIGHPSTCALSVSPTPPCAPPSSPVGPAPILYIQPATPVGPTSPCGQLTTSVGSRPLYDQSIGPPSSCAQPASSIPPFAPSSIPVGPTPAAPPCAQLATSIYPFRPSAQPEDRFPSSRQVTWLTPEGAEAPRIVDVPKTETELACSLSHEQARQDILTSDEENDELQECNCSRRKRRKRCRGKPYCFMPSHSLQYTSYCNECEYNEPFCYGIPCPFGIFYF